MCNGPTSVTTLLHIASKDGLGKRVADSFLEASIRAPLHPPHPRGQCSEAEGLQVDKPYHNDAVYSRTVPGTPKWGRTPFSPKKNPGPLLSQS